MIFIKNKYENYDQDHFNNNNKIWYCKTNFETRFRLTKRTPVCKVKKCDLVLYFYFVVIDQINTQVVHKIYIN